MARPPGSARTTPLVITLVFAVAALGCARGSYSPATDAGECICDSPPADFCVDRTTLRRYDGSGFCLVDQCEYTFDDEVCAAGCAHGACRADACAGVSCDSPPASECIDASTLRLFDLAASCRNGACEYESRELSCAAGCAAGACLREECGAILCDSPPSQCHEPAGRCVDGECTYDERPASASCDDGDACTIDDRCGGGICSGTAVVCDAPSGPTCVDASTLRSYGTTGTCSAGTCTFAPSDTHCPGGCNAGSCLDACANTACDTPPAPACVNASTLRTYGAAGACSAGTCTYPATDTYCPVGCDSGACASTCTPMSWSTETAESTAFFTGLDASIAVDAWGGVHIAYTAGGERVVLRYAYRRSRSDPWTIVTAANTDSANHVPSIAVDASGGVHISYYFEPLGELHYLYRSPTGSFSSSVVERFPVRSIAVESSIAIDADGRVHIAYANWANDGLRYAFRTSAGAWDIEILDANPCDSPDLAIDAGGGLHLAYVRGRSGTTSYQLGYAHRPFAGSFSTSTADPSTSIDGPSLVVDERGRVHVSYWNVVGSWDYGRWEVRYSVREPNGEWIQSTIFNVSRRGARRTSIALDGFGALHIGYSDNDSSHRIRHGYRSSAGIWTASTIDLVGADAHAGHESSFALDSSGAVHVAYNNDTTGVLRYAYGRVCP